jgi:hypothetical protein
MGVITSIVAGVAAVGSAIGSARSAKKGVKAGKAANAAQLKATRLKNEQAKRSFMRKFRQAQAANLTAGIAAGVGLESSTIQGGAASLRTQAADALAEFKVFDELGVEVSSQRQKQSDATARAAAFGAVSSFASKFISFGGGAPKTPSGTP